MATQNKKTSDRESAVAFAVLFIGIGATFIDNRPVQFAAVLAIIASAFLFGRTLRKR